MPLTIRCPAWRVKGGFLLLRVGRSPDPPPAHVGCLRCQRRFHVQGGIRLSYEMDSDRPPDEIRVVVADGDPQARKSVRETLTAGGIAVVAEAADGDEA